MTSRPWPASAPWPPSTRAGPSRSPSTARSSGARSARRTSTFIEIFWDAFYLKCDANDLLAQMSTWWHNDLGDHPNFGGDFEAALGAITARTIIIRGDLDRYFPPVDSAYEASHIPGGELRVIPGIWGHMAPFNPEDQRFIDAALRELLGD